MSTDSTRSERPRGASGKATAPAPLSGERVAKVPGVLGQIARERAKDYRDFVWPANEQGGSATGGASRQGGVENEPVSPPGSSQDADGRIESGHFAAALAGTDLAIIAEIKRASPSRGAIAALDPGEAALAYREGGASALSVLTEPRHFGGDLSHIALARAASELPVLRKDFTVHPGQLFEAQRAGAAAVLLIVALTGDQTASYLGYARSLGLDAIVEVHDEPELELALVAGADIIGVNNRDLRSLEIDLETAPRLIGLAREAGFGGLLVAESGYSDREHVEALQGVADAVLVGTSLAGSGDLTGSLRRLLGVAAK